MDQDRSASLLIRVWLEGGTDEFRARLTSVGTSPGGEDGAELTVAVASSASGVVSAVQAWLTAFLGSGTDTGADPLQ